MSAQTAAPRATVLPTGQISRKRKRFRVKDVGVFSLLILPNLAMILTFSYWPTLYNAFFSLTDWDFVQPSPIWVGLKNYVDLFQGSEFYLVLRNTAVFTFFTVIVTTIGGLAIAMLLAQKTKISGIARTMTFAPHMIPGAVVGILWMFMFDPQYGLSRWAFELFGQSSPQWTATSQWSLWAIIIAYSWQRLGFVAIIYYCAILDLPAEVFEAAQMDGAHGWRLFRHMTYPLLHPVTYFILITGIIASAQAFDIIATLTEGGPGVSSATLTWMVYQKAFIDFDIGSAAAQAMVLFVILMIVTIIQVKIGSKRVDE